MTFVQNIAIYTGSARGSRPAYAEVAEAAARTVARRGHGVVYGGGNVGLMKVVADAALAEGGAVYGVIPSVLVDGETAHPGLTQIDVVPDMHTRKARMIELADAFIAFPGGTGTLEELFEVWTWQQLGIHSKPVALFNPMGFWDPMLAAISSMIEAGFLRPAYLEALIVDENIDRLLDRLTAWTPPPVKWEALPADQKLAAREAVEAAGGSRLDVDALDAAAAASDAAASVTNPALAGAADPAVASPSLR